MPLNPGGLVADLTPFFANPPATEAQCAARWATILRSYTSLIAPPVPAPAQDAAGAALQAALTGMSAPGTALAVFDAAFLTYAAALAIAMPLPGVPPPAPLSALLSAAFASNNAPTATHATAASSIGTAIDIWFRTGLNSVGAPWV